MDLAKGSAQLDVLGFFEADPGSALAAPITEPHTDRGSQEFQQSLSKAMAGHSSTSENNESPFVKEHTNVKPKNALTQSHMGQFSDKPALPDNVVLTSESVAVDIDSVELPAELNLHKHHVLSDLVQYEGDEMPLSAAPETMFAVEAESTPDRRLAADSTIRMTPGRTDQDNAIAFNRTLIDSDLAGLQKPKVESRNASTVERTVATTLVTENSNNKVVVDPSKVISVEPVAADSVAHSKDSHLSSGLNSVLKNQAGLENSPGRIGVDPTQVAEVTKQSPKAPISANPTDIHFRRAEQANSIGSMNTRLLETNMAPTSAANADTNTSAVPTVSNGVTMLTAKKPAPHSSIDFQKNGIESFSRLKTQFATADQAVVAESYGAQIDTSEAENLTELNQRNAIQVKGNQVVASAAVLAQANGAAVSRSAKVSSVTNIDASALTELTVGTDINESVLSMPSVTTGARLGSVSEGSSMFTTPININSPDLPVKLSQHVLSMAENGVRSATLRVHPAELGPIQIDIAVEAEQITVNIAAAQTQSRDLLEASLPRLREQLSDQEFTQVDVNVGSEKQESGHLADGSARESDSDKGFNFVERELEEDTSRLSLKDTAISHDGRIDAYA
ncbi:MAG: flagellar hook-length control protein FliK [Gammaproteobacteria bacterium]|nr:flagellar hook-length control protein FliK [Gammaproteobacteria bacterium]